MILVRFVVDFSLVVRLKMLPPFRSVNSSDETSPKAIFLSFSAAISHLVTCLHLKQAWLMKLPGRTDLYQTIPENGTTKFDYTSSKKAPKPGSMVAFAEKVEDLPVSDTDTVPTCTGFLLW